MQQGSQPNESGKLSIGSAILTGQLIINGPVIVIIVGSAWLGYSLLGKSWWILFIIGFVLSWLWWSFMGPRWRNWAVQKGAPAEKLHQAAVASGLGWPKGHVFERTEIEIKK
jgi:hypothetical protein